VHGQTASDYCHRLPKKTVYGCWRQWGLRGYRVGRYLRFRERHVEEWLQTREI
jgi:excisionase family DNA binding protein